ncbi:hypothetical protein Clacol_002563 [Clathrus columnatus]|uniref:Origin recognition complex subunit 1 n=1 Tax=Clathrus columnatus TaxID=1419009 RepID=A0AAV5A4H6_9AGAM|nr:hypothetical protein Clacol_002563 [Clathrus columnatus]
MPKSCRTTPVTTPSRRSMRYKIQAADSQESNIDGYIDSWLEPALYTRCTSFEDDLHQPEIDVINTVEARSETTQLSLKMNTTFYKAFSRTKGPPATSPRKRQKLGAETYGVGDTVFVKSQTGIHNVAVIISMWNTEILEGEFPDSLMHNSMKVQVQWFMRPHQCAMVRKHRKFYQNELYFTTDQVATLDPSSITDHCTVSNTPDDTSALIEMYPEQASRPKTSIKDFVCRSALNSGQGQYYELNWEEHREFALSKLEDKAKYIWRIDNATTQSKPQDLLGSRQLSSYGENVSDEEASDYGNIMEEDNSSESEDLDLIGHDGDEDVDDKKARKSPSKVKNELAPLTGRKRRKQPTLTPDSKTASRLRKKRNRANRDFSAILSLSRLATDSIRLENLPSDPYLRVMRLLHVGARPDALPCREDEYMEVMSTVLSLLEEGSGGCVYISGVPGTGKTATVHNVIRDLKSMARRSEVNPFTYVEINGLRVSEPSNAYSLLWEAVSNHDAEIDGKLDIRSKEALRNLNLFFTAGVRAGPGGHACIVLMDELDQLVTPKQDIIYNFFNWPNLSNSKLIVVAVANTHDLPERVMSGKVRSRLGMLRINFHPYTRDQLQKIVEARLTAAKEGTKSKDTMDIFEQDAIKFAAMKISGVSGDARRILDVCRRSVELILSTNDKLVRIAHVKQVIDSMQNSPTAAFLRDCSLHERILLAALLKCIKREGVDEIAWSDVAHQHLMYMNTLTDLRDAPMRKPSALELSLVLDSLVASRAVILDIAVNPKKPPSGRKVMLNLEAGEVERVLSEVGGTNWRNALGM